MPKRNFSSVKNVFLKIKTPDIQLIGDWLERQMIKFSADIPDAPEKNSYFKPNVKHCFKGTA